MIDPRLESWLQNLESALSSQTVGDRARALAAADSEIQSRMRNGQPIEAILAELGKPESAAQRWLAAAPAPAAAVGFSTPLPENPVRTFLKRALLAVVILFLVAMLSAGWWTWRFFSHLTRQDEPRGQGMQSFRYWLQTPGDGQSSSGTFSFDGENSRSSFKGQVSVPGLKDLHFNSPNAELDISVHQGPLTYECEWQGSEPLQQDDIIIYSEDATSFEFPKSVQSARCKIQLPAGIRQHIQIENGKIDSHQISRSSEIKLKNGNVHLWLADKVAFDVQASVRNGQLLGLEKVEHRQAQLSGEKQKLNIEVGNGRIEVE